MFLLSSGHLRLHSWNIIITYYTLYYSKTIPNKPSVYTFRGCHSFVLHFFFVLSPFAFDSFFLISHKRRDYKMLPEDCIRTQHAFSTKSRHLFHTSYMALHSNASGRPTAVWYFRKIQVLCRGFFQTTMTYVDPYLALWWAYGNSVLYGKVDNYYF